MSLGDLGVLGGESGSLGTCLDFTAENAEIAEAGVLVHESEPQALDHLDLGNHNLTVTPLTCCSMGAATVSESTSALAPG
jgi:hypothetical protein